MGEVKDAWDAVGDGFAVLGRRVKEHWDRRVASGETADTSTIDEALRTLATTIDGALATAREAVADPGVREDARQAAASFGDALAATFVRVGEEIQRTFGSDAGPGSG